MWEEGAESALSSLTQPQLDLCFFFRAFFLICLIIRVEAAQCLQEALNFSSTQRSLPLRKRAKSTYFFVSNFFWLYPGCVGRWAYVNLTPKSYIYSFLISWEAEAGGSPELSWNSAWEIKQENKNQKENIKDLTLAEFGRLR